MNIELVPCQWPQCVELAKAHVHYGFESIHVCMAHRSAVKVNIEQYDKIWTFKKQIEDSQLKESDIVRPGDQRPVYKGQPTLTGHVGAISQQETAQRADAAATPLLEVSELVEPRQNKSGDKALSEALEAKRQGE